MLVTDFAVFICCRRWDVTLRSRAVKERSSRIRMAWIGVCLHDSRQSTQHRSSARWCSYKSVLINLYFSSIPLVCHILHLKFVCLQVFKSFVSFSLLPLWMDRLRRSDELMIAINRLQISRAESWFWNFRDATKTFVFFPSLCFLSFFLSSQSFNSKSLKICNHWILN